jgi:hypothetical protein
MFKMRFINNDISQKTLADTTITDYNQAIGFDDKIYNCLNNELEGGVTDFLKISFYQASILNLLFHFDFNIYVFENNKTMNMNTYIQIKHDVGKFLSMHNSDFN